MVSNTFLVNRAPCLDRSADLIAAPAVGVAGDVGRREHAQLEEGLPAVWMVKLIDMANNGRRDMVNAIQRAGGYDMAVERLG